MVVQGVILTMSWLELLEGNVSSRNENCSLFLPQNGKSYCCSRLLSKLPKKSVEVSLNLSPKQLFFPTSSHCLCFFSPTETKLKTFCKVSVRCGARPALPESLRSLVEFRPWFHICHICDFIFATFVISYLPLLWFYICHPPPSSSPVDIFLRTGICHFRCVKAATDNQTAGGAKPSLFCKMPCLYFSEKSFLYLLL